MNKADLVKQVAARANLTQADAANAIDAVTRTITEALVSGDDVALVGFGVFSVKARAARLGRNPKTGEEIQIAATQVPDFKAGKGLKDAVKD